MALPFKLPICILYEQPNVLLYCRLPVLVCNDIQIIILVLALKLCVAIILCTYSNIVADFSVINNNIIFCLIEISHKVEFRIWHTHHIQGDGIETFPVGNKSFLRDINEVVRLPRVSGARLQHGAIEISETDAVLPLEKLDIGNIGIPER